MQFDTNPRLTLAKILTLSTGDCDFDRFTYLQALLRLLGFYFWMHFCSIKLMKVPRVSSDIDFVIWNINA